MGAPSVSVRCPTCGSDLRVVLAPAPPTQWFPCPHCRNPVPVLVPRDPPPLYSWEVLPGLYPPLPTPRRPRVRARRLAQAALIAITVTSVILASLLAILGAEAPASGSYVVSGTVYDSVPSEGGSYHVPAAGASIVLTTDGGSRLVAVTDPTTGGFSFSGVPVGGIALNISQSGYAPVTVVTFASSVYDAGTTGLVVTLVPGSVGNGTTVALSPFPDLESFLASVGSGVVLLGLVAVIGAVGAVVTARSDRPAVGVVGGAAALLAPAALGLLSLGGVFPELLLGTAVLASLGAFAATVRGIEIFQQGPSERSS